MSGALRAMSRFAQWPKLTSHHRRLWRWEVWRGVDRPFHPIMSGPAKPTTNHPRGKIVIGEPAKEEVLGFLASTFQSVWALEVLCLLRQNRSRSVAHAEIVSSLRGSDLIVNQSVRTLVAAGLVVVEDDGGARYTPVTPAIERLVDAAVGMYAKRPDAVRRVIVSAANPNITAFADAFRLRKD